jgi:hypothetical protein
LEKRIANDFGRRLLRGVTSNADVVRPTVIVISNTLPESITELETHGQSLSLCLKILEEIRVLMNKAPNEIDIEINKNKGWKILQNISKIINGEKPDENNIPEDITTDDISQFK